MSGGAQAEVPGQLALFVDDFVVLPVNQRVSAPVVEGGRYPVLSSFAANLFDGNIQVANSPYSTNGLWKQRPIPMFRSWLAV